MLRIKIFVCVLFFMLAGAGAAESQKCVDDERFASIIDVLKQIAADEEIEALVITPRTYLNTKEAVLKRLGDNIVFCPEMTPVIGGEPLTKVEADFDLIFRHIIDAVRERKDERIAMISDFFGVKSVSLKDALRFNTGFGVQQSIVDYVYEKFGIDYRPEGGNRAQFYERLGGKIKGENNILFAGSERFMNEKEIIDLTNAGIVISNERLNDEIKDVYKNLGAEVMSSESDWKYLIDNYGEERW